jgi:membrane-bound lytic murein transglycosylase D
MADACGNASESHMGWGKTTGRRAMVLVPIALVLVLVLSALLSGGVAAESAVPHSEPAAATDPFPPVPGLRPQVEFWIDVFTHLRQNEVLLHDTQFPRLRYEVYTLPGTVDAGLSRDQVRFIDARKQRLAARLETLEDKLGHGESLSPSEKELQRLLEAAGGRDAVHDAALRVRSQRGLREQFLAGVRRSGRYMAQMRRIFAEEKLPPDLAYLPHVESSFNIAARSTAGAAGIWQFTRPTGRHYLHVSDAIDERLDPIAATRAAAAYLRSAHELLDDWGLAVTSYNHGTTGVLRASNLYGRDLERIVREYHSDSFGFASRNFYTEFLAVREILSHPETYFDAPLELDAPVQLQSLVLPRPVSAPRLARVVGADIGRLAEANPAWMDRAVRGKVSLPANTEVWLPVGMRIAADDVTSHLRVAERHAPPLPVLDGQARTGLYRVRTGDTLGSIALRQDVNLSALRSLNGISPDSGHIRAGQQLKLPAGRTESRRAAATTMAKPGLHLVRDGENPFVIAQRYRISLSSLLAENGLVQDAIIHPGQHLRIPAETKP